MSTNLLTDWREGIQDLLATAFPGVDVQGEIWPGELDTISRDQDRIRVVLAPLTPDANVNNTRPKLIVRYWLTDPKISGLTSQVPRDPAAIEQIMIDLAAAFQAQLTSVGGMDYYHVGSITPDRARYAIEVELVGWTRNPAEDGG